MSDILEQRLDLAETKPVLQKSSSVSLEKPVNDENEDPQHASPTKVKKLVNDRASLEEKEGTADSEKNLESSKVPTSDETGATIAPLSLPTSIPTPIFLKRKMSAKEAIDCTPKRMSTTKRRREQKTVQDEEDTTSKCRLFEGDDSSSDSDSSL